MRHSSSGIPSPSLPPEPSAGKIFPAGPGPTTTSREFSHSGFTPGRRNPRGPAATIFAIPPYKHMKLSVTSLLAILTLGTGVATLSTGCAGTATRESTGEYIDDTTMTTKVKAAFVKDPVVKAIDVKVDSFKGVVQLSGFVDTAEQKARAEQIAAGITGVTSVKNNISVKAPQ
jgi:hyperosmotically inducible periplasmic protein